MAGKCKPIFFVQFCLPMHKKTSIDARMFVKHVMSYYFPSTPMSGGINAFQPILGRNQQGAPFEFPAVLTSCPQPCSYSVLQSLLGEMCSTSDIDSVLLLFMATLSNKAFRFMPSQSQLLSIFTDN